MRNLLATKINQNVNCIIGSNNGKYSNFFLLFTVHEQTTNERSQKLVTILL